MSHDDLQPELTPEEGFDAGQILLSWETWDLPPVERSTRWYAISAVIGLGMIIYSLLTANFLFALIIVMFAVILLMRDLRKPTRVTMAITTEGIAYHHDFFPYKTIRDFAIIYEPPVSNLYISFKSRVTPTLSISLEDLDPNIVREQLLPFVFENLDRDNESLTDTLSRVYKL
jgi:hypothetical protein